MIIKFIRTLVAASLACSINTSIYAKVPPGYVQQFYENGFDGNGVCSECDMREFEAYTKCDPVTDSYTISFWFTPQLSEDWKHVLSKGNLYSYIPGWSFWLTEQGVLYFRVGTTDGQKASVGAQLPEMNIPYHIVAVIDQDKQALDLFINGNNINTFSGGAGASLSTLVDSFGEISSNDVLNVGGDYNTTLSHVRFYDRALELCEVLEFHVDAHCYQIHADRKYSGHYTYDWSEFSETTVDTIQALETGSILASFRTNKSGYHTIFAGSDASTITYNIRLTLENGILHYRKNNEIDISCAGSSLNDGKYHKVAVVTHEDHTKIYVDGAEVGSSTQSIYLDDVKTSNGMDTATVGCRKQSDGIKDYFYGFIGHVRIIDKPLSEKQLEYYFNRFDPNSEDDEPMDFVVDETVFHRLAEDNSFECYRIPAVVADSDGTLYAFAEKRIRTYKNGVRGHCEDVGFIDLVMKIKRAGETWSQEFPVVINEPENYENINCDVDDDMCIENDPGSYSQENPNGYKHWHNPSPVYDSDKNMIALVFMYDRCMAYYKIINLPDWNDPEWDNNWNPALSPENPIEVASSVGATTPGHGIRLANGKLLVAARTQGNSSPLSLLGSWALNSITWESSPVIQYVDNSNEIQNFPGDETQAVQLDNGEIVMTIRSKFENSYFFERPWVKSDNDGSSWHNWQESQTLNGVFTPRVQSSIIKATCGDEEILLFSSPTPVNRFNGTIWYKNVNSSDLSHGWSNGLLLEQGHFSYSDMVDLGKGEIGILHEHDTNPSRLKDHPEAGGIHFAKIYYTPDGLSVDEISVICD
ncbi:MAG: exo-alpha-sialidase [Myxococcota bacterium]|nr:exo-alpha-sialidase [Myxococcota bacterium]